MLPVVLLTALGVCNAIEERLGADFGGGGFADEVLVVTGVDAIEEALDDGLLLILGLSDEVDCLLEGVEDGTERF